MKDFRLYIIILIIVAASFIGGLHVGSMEPTKDHTELQKKYDKLLDSTVDLIMKIEEEGCYEVLE